VNNNNQQLPNIKKLFEKEKEKATTTKCMQISRQTERKTYNLARR
jgi:hypothetical protein